MPDDPKVVSLRPPRKPERALCTGHVPSECPDAPHVRLDGLRRPTGKPTTLPADLAPMGRDPSAWPFTGDAKRRELRELRQRADSLVEAAASLEIASRLVRTEAETISRRIAEMGGDEPSDPKGAA